MHDPDCTDPLALCAPLDVVARCHELGLCPQTPRRLEAVKGEADLEALAEIVGTDPVLASRLIGVANTAYLAGAQPILTVTGAVRRVGVRMTMELAWALALHPIGAEQAGGRVLLEHAQRVAVATRALSYGVPGISTGNAFTVGLLHDIGAQVLLALEPTLYGDLLREFGVDGPGLMVRERAAFGIDHPLVADLCLESWGLPDRLRQTIAVHHDLRPLAPSHVPDEVATFAGLLAMGEHLTRMHGHGFHSDTIVVSLVSDPVNRIVGLREGVIRSALAGFDEDLGRLRAVLDGQNAPARRAS